MGGKTAPTGWLRGVGLMIMCCILLGGALLAPFVCLYETCSLQLSYFFFLSGSQDDN